jgi:hypothetical protein
MLRLLRREYFGFCFSEGEMRGEMEVGEEVDLLEESSKERR